MKINMKPRHGYHKAMVGIVLLASCLLFVGAPCIGSQSTGYRIAVLTTGLSSSLVLEGLREGLAQLGYHEGKNITVMVEDVQGEVASLAGRAAKIVQAKPDLIFSIGTAPTITAKQATTTLPIVFAFVGDPIRSGLVASYASSKNNLTGISTSSGLLSGKRLEILQEISPQIKRVLLLVAAQEGGAEVSFQSQAEVAPKLGIELLRHDVHSKEDIVQTLNALPNGAVDAISLVPSSLVAGNIDLLIHKAKEARMPLIVHEVSMVERGALVSYGADYRLIGIQAAKLVAKVLLGAKPSELPIQTPDKLLLAINLSTARSIGLDIPGLILERTDHFVE